MTNFRALCAELIDDIELCDWPYKLKETIRADIDRARAALADEPAVPEGREPAAVTGQPSDEEPLRMAAEAIDPYDEIGIGEYEAETECAVEVYGSELIAFARAVLARWGNPAPPADGEVAELTGQLIEAANGAAAMGWDQHAQRILRAAELLQRQAMVPVAVSERLPGPEDCDAEGRCWLRGKVEGDWRLINPAKSGVPKLKYCFSHWLPATALPLPEVGE